MYQRGGVLRIGATRQFLWAAKAVGSVVSSNGGRVVAISFAALSAAVMLGWLAMIVWLIVDVVAWLV